MDPRWLEWSRRLQAIAQNGLAYVHDPFDRERYEQIRELASEIAAEYSSADMRAIQDLFRGETGYATPKVDVRGVAFQDGRILLVQEKSDGLWTLPGGWADVGESPSDAVTREVREESGLETRAVKLLAVLDRSKHPHPPSPWHIYKLIFRCEITGGRLAPGPETIGAEFFPEDALPDLSTSRTALSQIKRLFQHFQHPDLPADFD